MKFSNIALLSAFAVSALAEEAAQIFYSCLVPNTIAFTIDDGPTEKTPELLAALRDANIKATFYVNGANIMKDVNGDPLPSVVPFIKQIYDDGHEIGSHTYNHACLTAQCKLNNPLMIEMSTKEIFTEQITKNEDLIYKAIGKYPASYRAPFGDGQNSGAVSQDLLNWLYELGYPYAIHWDIETQDMEFSNQSDDIAFQKAQEHYNSDIGQKNTLITLQHAIPVTIEKIIPWLKDVWMPAHPDMKFVKVSECLGLTDDDVYKDAPGPKIPNSNAGKVEDESKSGSTSLLTGLLGTIAIVLFNIILNNY